MKEKKKLFYKLKGSVKRKPYFVYDIENNTETGEFVLGAAIRDEKLYKFHDRMKMIDWLFGHKNRGRYGIAHFGLYDLSCLFAHDIPKIFPGKNFAKKGSRLIFARKKSGNNQITFIDSFNHSFESLDRIGKRFGMEKIDGFGMDHCVRDVEMLDLFVKTITDQYYQLGCNFRVTLPSTVMDLYRREWWRGPGWKRIDKKFIDFMRQAYFGAWTDCGILAKVTGKIFQYDINSSYPNVLQKNKYPIIASFGFTRTIQDIMDYDGVSEVDVITDDAILPVRKRDGSIYFPKGRLRGIWSHVLLRECVARGYKIYRLHKGIKFEKSDYLFSDFMKMLYDLRKKDKK
jgi:hypothetical protein